MHTSRLGVWAVTFVLTLVACAQQPVGDSNSAKAQPGPPTAQVQPGSSRAIAFRVAPEYPRLAAAMNLTGTVQLQAVVRADGTVKRVKVIGGHPVLAEAASAALMRWRYEVGPRETTEAVKISFGR